MIDNQRDLLILILISINVINFLLLINITKMLCKLRCDIPRESDIEESLKTTIKEIELKRRTDEINKKFKIKKSRLIRIVKTIFGVS